MPQASSLFKAIINKNEDINADAQLDSILSAKENSFTAKTSLKTVEEEPELFPNHNPKPFSASRKEEPERLIVNDDDEEYTPTLIERAWCSIANLFNLNQVKQFISRSISQF